MLATLLSPIIGALLGQITDLGKLYLQKQITKEEMPARVKQAEIEAQKAIDAAVLEAQASMWSEFQQTTRVTPVVARAYAATLVFASFTWVWTTLGAGAFEIITGERWPMPDGTLLAASSLIGVCLGGGAVLLREK
jgi:hypothetical protein